MNTIDGYDAVHSVWVRCSLSATTVEEAMLAVYEAAAATGHYIYRAGTVSRRGTRWVAEDWYFMCCDPKSMLYESREGPDG